jgi:hypothetical protein
VVPALVVPCQRLAKRVVAAAKNLDEQIQQNLNLQIFFLVIQILRDL